MEFKDKLKVVFFEGEKIIEKKDGNSFSKLEDDNSLYLDLTNPKDREILNLLKSQAIHIEGEAYSVKAHEFFLDADTLFIVLEKC